MRKHCGPAYKSLLRPQKRQEVKYLMKRPGKEAGVTLLVHGSSHDVKCFRAEAFYLAVRNGLTALYTDDSILVKLNFNELGSVPDTTLEDVTELERLDFLWLDICTTKNVYIPYQIMRLIDRREQEGKRTIIYSPDLQRNTWQRQYESDVFIKYLEGFQSQGRTFKIENYK
jgi:hypothetical protein